MHPRKAVALASATIVAARAAVAEGGDPDLLPLVEAEASHILTSIYVVENPPPEVDHRHPNRPSNSHPRSYRRRK